MCVIAICVQALEIEMRIGKCDELEGEEQLVVLRRMLRDAGGDTSFATASRTRNQD